MPFWFKDFLRKTPFKSFQLNGINGYKYPLPVSVLLAAITIKIIITPIEYPHIPNSQVIISKKILQNLIAYPSSILGLSLIHI